ncbi:hypothetical protein COT68_03030 [bacterium (Candidatus Torokbacteria) CG09_land_8_20_14_0_10_42_11]|nr:MAG: hypothetical protein COT68_03030 [bacterium (Candidatus Torokbacteria) CG09_land_8_20_14_0_10_42_11]
MKPKIVCFGGGTGQATVLQGLKKYNCGLVGVVNVTDNGGSSGALRREMGIPQTGDTRNCLEKVSDPDNILTKIFAYRFQEGSLSGASLGNLILAALTRLTGNFGEAVMAANSLLKTQVQIYPVTIENTDIACELASGEIVKGEWEIILRKDRAKIQSLFLTKKAEAFPPVLDAIRQANLIVIGPGSLFTGILPHFLVTGVREAIQKSKAKKVYICNMMTQPGQTDRFTVLDHVSQIKKYLGASPDYVIMNKSKIKPEILEHYKNFGSHPVETSKISGVKVIAENLAQNQIDEAVHLENTRLRSFREWSEWTHLLRHDAEKLAEILIKLVK